MFPETAVTSFSLGLLAMTSPCVLPLYPGFLAFLGASQASTPRWGRPLLGLCVLAGVLTMMLALGLLIAALSVSVGQALAVAIPLADLLILGLGLLLLANINVFKSLPQVRAPGLANPFASAFVYGLFYGPIALPCSGPLVVSIFVLSVTAEEAFSRLAVFLWFGLGFGLPLLALSFLSNAWQRQLTRLLAHRARWVNLAGGLLLITIAVYDLWTNWPMLSLYWA